MDESLTVKTVSLLSGVSAHTLRAWERRYRAVSPKRTKTGRRVYCRADVEKLKLLRRLLEEGYAIGGIARMPLGELNILAQKLPTVSEALSPGKAAEPVLDPALLPCIRDMLAALSDYKLDLLDYELMRARMTFTVRTLILNIFAALMTEVGNLVQSKNLGIAQEHALSALLRGHLSQIFQSFSVRSENGLRVVLSTPEGDLHEFGILMSAILCASYGMTVHYLGPNLPAEDLAEAATGTRAQVVVLGCTSLPPGTTPSSLKSYLKRLTGGLRSGSQVWVGGECAFDLSKVSFGRDVRHVATLSLLDDLLARFNQTPSTFGGKS